MSRELTPYQQKAISLRDYLSGDRIKSQISDALPKWLSPDRFFRVVFGAILRNPKLVECSTESILSAVMYCAQLGVEPILGRAYLVPYAGECQAQVGYQGLVDLARRSNTISDVWGAAVFENDDFDLSYGMERTLTHRPWFMDKAKRAAGEAGECIGAYVVWQLKDGTKHPEFMPVSEINKRRAKSPAYNWAETGPPGKGGGKKDSIWHQWPEEMQLKTVIKHSSKLVPANIEFMEAVQLDDEGGGGGRGPSGGEFRYLPDKPAEIAGPAFEEVFADEVKDGEFVAFTLEAAKTYGHTVEDMKAKMVEQAEEAKKGFVVWKAKRATAAVDPPANAAAVPGMAETFRDEWISLKQKGFGPYVQISLDKFRAAPKEVRDEAARKWAAFYPDYPCPFMDDAKPAETEEMGAPMVEVVVQGGGPGDDPARVELGGLQARLRELAGVKNGSYVMQAKTNLGMVLSATPQNIDGCRVLIDEVERLLRERPPVNGK